MSPALRLFSACGATSKQIPTTVGYKGNALRRIEASIDLVPPTHPVPLRVTYQDACHLVHGQGIRQQPRKLLNMIPGLELIEMRESDVCCGSAGILYRQANGCPQIRPN